jgi:pimeloyl-ACP methyl ester carboxylesterase
MTVAADVATGSRHVQAGGVRMHYREVGHGPPLVCLHGGGPGADSYSGFRANLPALSREFRLVLVDLPRFGGSEKVATALPRLSFYAGALRDFMAATGLERANFLGNSMGGQAAMKLAIDHPERVAALAVIGGTPIADAALSPMPAEGVRLLQQYYRGDGPSEAKMRQLMETMVFDSALVTEAAVRERYQASVAPDVLAMHAPGQPQPGLEFLDGQLAALAAPTLLVWGAQDRAGPLEIALRMLRLLPRAELHVFSRCGHWAQLEHTDAFNAVVTAFFQRTGGA